MHGDAVAGRLRGHVVAVFDDDGVEEMLVQVINVL